MTNANLISQIDEAIGAHGMWKMRLRAAMRTGRSDISAHDASCDGNCKFGQWLDSTALSPQNKADLPYKVVKRVHADFHRAAGHVLSSALGGRQREAEERIEGDFNPASEKLVRALMKWKTELQKGIRRAA